MKHDKRLKISVKSILCLIALLTTAVTVMAQEPDYFDFEVNGIYYSFYGHWEYDEETGEEHFVKDEGDSLRVEGYDHDVYEKELVIPSTVNYLGKTYRVTEISNCGGEKLTSVTIGRYVKSINLAFMVGFLWADYVDAPGISSVTCLAINPPATGYEYGDGAFTWIVLFPEMHSDQYVYENATLYVPKESVEAYRHAEDWENFVHIVGIDVPDEPVVPADVDGDGRVTIGDVTALIDYLLGNSSGVSSEDAADIDGDGRVTIGDVTALIDILLS